MANPNEEQRLRALYADLSDDQLLELAGQKSGLTADAASALAAEMASRGLSEDAEAVSEADSMPDLHAAEDDPTLVELMTFQVAADAERALLALDEADIPVRMEPAIRRLVEGGARIRTSWLTVFVERARQQDAVKVLRERMGLFPVLTPEEMDAPEGDGHNEDSLFTIGDFDLPEDAAIARNALTAAGIWFKETKIPEAEITVTVLETHLEHVEAALAVVEAAFAES